MLCGFVFSCNEPSNITILVSSDYLTNIDSIKTQTPYRVLNAGHGYRLSNLPTKLRDKRDSKYKYDAWDEITEKYKAESTVHIDTISDSKIEIGRYTVKWLYDNNNQSVEKRISISEFKELLNKEGVKSEDYKIIKEKEVEYDGNIKNTILHIQYKGTFNRVGISRKGEITVDTDLIQ